MQFLVKDGFKKMKPYQIQDNINQNTLKQKIYCNKSFIGKVLNKQENAGQAYF